MTSESPAPDPSIELKAQYHELASLAGGLAHEIRNPLGTIRLNVQLLAEDLAKSTSNEDKRNLRRIEVVQNECDRLADILDDFLRFARVSELEREPCDLSALMSDMIEFSRPRIEAAGITLRSDFKPNLPRVPLDSDLFRQAILNLLLNAESVMKTGGELIVQTRAETNHVVVDIIDTGPGIKPELKEKIFQPFFSTRPDGTGLGLPTAKRIIEAHGGNLSVESDLGRGTAFHVQLPTAPRP